MIPGYAIRKDPKAWVVSGYEDCFLFVKLEKSGDFDQFLTYTMAEGWQELDGVIGVYYREVKTADIGKAYSVLKDDKVTVKDTVTKEKMETAEQDKPTLKITAYASQLYKSAGVKFTAADAWANVNPTNP